MVPTPLVRKQLLFSPRTVALRPIPSRKGLQCLPELLTLRFCQWDNFLPPTKATFMMPRLALETRRSFTQPITAPPGPEAVSLLSVSLF